MGYCHDYKSLKDEEFKNKKDFKTEKNDHSPATNINNDKKNLSSYALGRLFKKYFCLNMGDL